MAQWIAEHWMPRDPPQREGGVLGKWETQLVEVGLAQLVMRLVEQLADSDNGSD